MSEQDGKLSKTDLWRMYRQPASVDALVPVAIILSVLREENSDGDGDGRALRFSRGIANELQDRGCLDGSARLHFQGDLIPIDGGFYAERLAAYGAGSRRSPEYQDMERLVRETYADNLVVPLHQLIKLHDEGHIPLPKALKARYDALANAVEPTREAPPQPAVSSAIMHLTNRRVRRTTMTRNETCHVAQSHRPDFQRRSRRLGAL